MIVLGLDTAAPACSVAILKDGAVAAAAGEPMMRGHQERLAPLVAEMMTAAGLAYGDIDRVAVTVGPGSFTGLRVGLAFAKALALALDRPCVGVGSLAALAAGGGPGMVIAVIDAKRDQLYLQAFSDGVPVCAPDVLDLSAALARVAELAGGGPVTLIGSGADLAAAVAPGAHIIVAAAPRPEDVARLGAAAPLTPPRPLYLRAPDARLPDQPAPL